MNSKTAEEHTTHKHRKKVVFTGGHHNSALAVALDLKKGGYDIYWLGHKYSMWGDKSPSAEYREVTSTGIPFYELKAGKFYRTYHPFKLARIPNGFIEAFKYLRIIKPNLIVSFGGYLAVPVAVIGWLMGIPVITHEQTAATGLSNKLIGKIATKILLTYSSSQVYFPKEKTAVVGLPITGEFFRYLQTPKRGNKPDIGRIFITCGKQGAHQINKNVYPIVRDLVKKYSIVHQTGASTVYNDYEKAVKTYEDLDELSQSRYKVVDYLAGSDNWKAWFDSDLIIARCGAHTIYQLGITGIPSLLIPIPWVVNNEQFKNAEILKKAGLAEILEERDLTPQTLSEMIESIMRNIEKYQNNSSRTRYIFPLDAKEKMVQIIKQILSQE